ncbi:MAG TPA: substrate-binding domain-containing protein [Anaerolineae bacterium]|nr:substrate-binding domain-containing protein [Anaerolineae bacterium]
MPEPSQAPVVRIGMQLLSSDPFWVLVREGIYQRAEQLHVTLVPVEVDLWQLTGDKQMEVIEEVLAMELHALLTQAMPPPLARLIANAGVPIVFLTETDMRHPLIAAPQGLHEVARMAAKFIADYIERRGRVLIVGGLMEGLDKGHSRLQGFHSVMDAYPQVEVEHIATSWIHETALDQVVEALSPLAGRFDAIFGLSDSTALAGLYGARQVGLADGRTLVVGINGDPLALAAILDGSMAATVETPAVELGRQALDLALAAVQGQPLPRHFSYRPRLITRHNVAQASAEKLAAMASLPNRLVGINRHQEQERLIQLETSLEISRRVGSMLDRRQLYYEIVDLIRTNYGYDEAQIFMWSMREREFVLDKLGSESEIAVRIPLPQSGLLGHTLLQNRPIFIPDMRHSHRFPPDPYWPATRSRVILPIRQGQDMIGLLDLHSRRPIQHSSSTLIGLQALADQLGTALRNAELYGEAVAARTEAERANQFKSRLLANVSHELRTPLNVIEGYSQAALARPDLYGVELPAGLLKDLRHIYTSSTHLERLINDLLDVSRAEIGELEILPELLDPRAVLSDAFDSMAGSLLTPEAVEWRLYIPESLPAVYADSGRLHQVLLNLLSNAGKFTARGRIVLGAEANGSHLHIWVEDTGSGIAPDMQARIFETFAAAEQSNRPGQAIGLGLRITHELVKLHQGTVSVESTPGIGAVFHVYLPLPAPGRQGDLEARPPVESRPLRFLDELDALPPHISELTRRAVRYVWQNYGHTFSREEIAGDLSVTPGYLTQHFRQELGITPWEYLTHVRIERAKELLTAGRLSITEVAGEVGYNDAAYFSRVFVKETGRTPRSFRQQASNSPK